MATSNDGFTNGKRGRVVYYMLNGKQVSRTIGIYDGKATERQLAVRLRTKLVSQLLKHFKVFLNAGYGAGNRKSRTQVWNAAFVYNRQHAVTGCYPDLRMDYSKLKISSGTLANPSAARAEVTDGGIVFCWDTGFMTINAHWTDQVMLMAWFPEYQQAVYMVAGARREAGTDLLPVYKIPKGTIVETYIAFMTADQRGVSDSIYTGQLTW